jgi:ABC-type glycerol-3-phosphate transport system substrate-binding protein
MKKKTLAVLLALTMLVGQLTACGGSAASTAESSAPAEESTTVAEPAETTQPEPEAEPEEASAAEAPADSAEEETAAEPESVPDYDLPLYEEPVTLEIFYPVRSGSHPSKSDERSVFWRRLEENLGYNFEWVEPYQSAASEQFNLVIAAGDLPHIFFESLISTSGSAYTGGYDVAVDEDVYLDLTPYLEEYAPHYNALLQDPSIYNDIVTEEGRIVPFATINEETAKTGMGPVINKEYFEATGLDLPTTVDELHDLAAAMKSNGVTSPLAVSEDGDIVEGLVAQALGASFEGTPIIDNATGELILDVTTDETRSYIELFQKWYSEGLLDKDFTSITEMDFTPFNNGTVGTASGMGFMIDSYYDMYGVYQQPLGVLHSDGLEDKQVLLKDWPDSPVSSMPGISLTTRCEEDDLVEPAMRLCDFFYSDYGYLVCNYGWVEGETYDIVDGKPIPNAFFDDRDPDINVAYKSLYTSDGDFGYVYPNFNFDTGSETLIEAAELWTLPEDQPNALYTTLPGNMKLNAKETEQASNALLDLQTYVESTVLLWMTGQTDLTDATWNDFVSNCQSMGLDDILAAYTSAYERYTGE